MPLPPPTLPSATGPDTAEFSAANACSAVDRKLAHRSASRPSVLRPRPADGRPPAPLRAPPAPRPRRARRRPNSVWSMQIGAPTSPCSAIQGSSVHLAVAVERMRTGEHRVSSKSRRAADRVTPVRTTLGWSPKGGKPTRRRHVGDGVSRPRRQRAVTIPRYDAISCAPHRIPPPDPALHHSVPHRAPAAQSAAQALPSTPNEAHSPELCPPPPRQPQLRQGMPDPARAAPPRSIAVSQAPATSRQAISIFRPAQVQRHPAESNR